MSEHKGTPVAALVAGFFGVAFATGTAVYLVMDSVRPAGLESAAGRSEQAQASLKETSLVEASNGETGDAVEQVFDSPNLLPDPMWSADGIFPGLDDGFLLMFDYPDGFDISAVERLYERQITSQTNAKLVSTQEAVELSNQGVLVPLIKIDLNLTKGMTNGRTAWAVHLDSNISSKVIATETNMLVRGHVWRSLGQLGYVQDGQQIAFLLDMARRNADEVIAALNAAESLKQRPMNEAEFNRALRGDYPR